MVQNRILVAGFSSSSVLVSVTNLVYFLFRKKWIKATKVELGRGSRRRKREQLNRKPCPKMERFYNIHS
jgi:hypothetical protein